MKRLPAYPLSIAMAGVQGLAFATVVTTNLVYQVETVGLNALQLVLVGTLLEATTLAFEVPTGVVADVYSRRLSILIGFVLMGAGFMVEGLIPLFAGVLAAQVVWGLGFTFTSGARTAWIADEVGQERLSAALLRGTQAYLIGGLVGISLAVALSSLSRGLPVVVGGAMFVALASLLALTMPERGFTRVPADRRQTLKTMGETLRTAFRIMRRQRSLLLVVAVPLLFGASSEIPDRLDTPFLLETITLPPLGPLDPVAWFGLSGYVGQGLSLAATEIARRKLDTSNDRAMGLVLVAAQAIYIGSLVAFALATNLALALAMLWMRGPLFAVSGPLLSVLQNRVIPSRVRATMLSLGAQANALGQLIAGPALGAVALGVSLRAGFLGSALVLVPVVVILLILSRQRASVPDDG